MGALAFAGALSFYGTWAWLGPLGVTLSLPLALRPSGVWLASAIALAVAGSVCRWWLRVRLPTDFTIGLHYPPVWFAVILSLGLVLIVEATGLSPLTNPVRLPLDPPTSALAILFAATALWPRATVIADRTREPAPLSEVHPSVRLLEWAERETPAGPGQPDFFGHHETARRLARHLREADQTIALLGPFGCGKTTVVNWLRSELSTDPRFWICHVNAWGLEDSRAAPSYVLAQILDTLDQRVDCQSLRGLPAAYLRVLSVDPSGFAQRLAPLLAQPDTPLDSFEAIATILKAAEARLILVIEDIDRAGPDFHPEHVLRLLWTLRQVQGVTFVLAFDPAATKIDYAKLCDHVELLPRMDNESIAAPLRELIDYCRSTPTGTEPIIDPPGERKWPEALEIAEAKSRLEEYARHEFGTPTANGLSLLLATPRTLKHLIRRTRKVWDNLRGEIDLADVILLAVLRECVPQAFQFLVTNMDAIRRGEPGALPGAVGDERKKALRTRWHVARGDGPTGDAVQALVDALGFPQLTEGARKVPLQGVAAKGPTDYFRRFLAESLAAGELRDQVVLKDMRAYAQGEKGTMLQSLLSATEDENRYVAVWRHFAEAVPDDRLLLLAEELAKSLLVAHGSVAPPRHPALIAAWQQCSRRLGRHPAHVDWLIGVCQAAAPVSLRFLDDLYYFWASVRYGVVDEDGRRRVREAIAADVQARYSSAATLESALDPSWPWAIRALVSPEDAEEPVSSMVEASQWRWLARPMMDGLARNPTVFLPEVANLVTDSQHQLRVFGQELRQDDTYTLNRVRVEGLFGELLDSFLAQLAMAKAADGRVGAAGQQAEEWLAARHAVRETTETDPAGG